MSGRDAKFYGLHACEALAARRPEAIHRAFFDERTAKRFGPLMSSMASRRRPYRVVSDEELAKVASTRHHEGVCLIADPPAPPRADEWLRQVEQRAAARLVFLDGVANPHNVGAILRTCAHFGADGLAGLRDELPSPSGATARVAQGAVEHVPMLPWPDPGRALARLAEHGFARVATVVDGGRDLFDVTLPPRCVFLLGAEDEGLSEAARGEADLEVTIPGSGRVESLNVATACGVLLAEHWRATR